MSSEAGEIAFDKYAVKGAYHWTELYGPIHKRNAYTRARYDAVLGALDRNGMPRSARVLDVGCGDAALAGLIAMRRGARVVGIDTTGLSIELARAEFAQRGLAGEFHVIDGYRYPFDDAAFDAVVCSDVIEHVQEPERLLAEMWRVLKPGGLAVLTTPVRYTERPLDRMHVQEWFPEAFQALCAESLGVPVELRLSHPVALSELYALGTPITGRLARLAINLLAAAGRNPFDRLAPFRAGSTQTAIARKRGP